MVKSRKIIPQTSTLNTMVVQVFYLGQDLLYMDSLLSFSLNQQMNQLALKEIGNKAIVIIRQLLLKNEPSSLLKLLFPKNFPSIIPGLLWKRLRKLSKEIELQWVMSSLTNLFPKLCEQYLKHFIKSWWVIPSEHTHKYE